MSDISEDVKRLAAEAHAAFATSSDTRNLGEIIEAAILADRETRGEPEQRMFCTSCGSGIHEGQCDCTRMQRPAPVVAEAETRGEPVAYTTSRAIADLSAPGVCAVSASRSQSEIYPVPLYAAPQDASERIRQLEAEKAELVEGLRKIEAQAYHCLLGYAVKTVDITGSMKALATYCDEARALIAKHGGTNAE